MTFSNRPRTRKRQGVAPLAALIPRVYPGGEPEESVQARVFGAFCRSVSDRVLANAGPVRLRDGVLTVHTSTSAWADALSLDTPEILAKMRARLGSNVPKRIALRCGPFTAPHRPPPSPKLKRLDLSALPPAVAKELAHIAHDGLRDAVARAALTALSHVSESKG